MIRARFTDEEGNEHDDVIAALWPDKWKRALVNKSYRGSLRRAYQAYLRMSETRSAGGKCLRCVNVHFPPGDTTPRWCRVVEDHVPPEHLCSSYQPRKEHQQ